ncbi:MAG TPA: hypothetical protein VFJ81_00695, partial [Gemmatimonadales bacterium]|nr:hypothetical protein [Gemmatimonadales bacterium]
WAVTWRLGRKRRPEQETRRSGGQTAGRSGGWWSRAPGKAAREATMELPALEAVAGEASFASGGAAASSGPGVEAPDADGPMGRSE